MTHQYVICSACKIGGYDYCDKCLGAGGYSINVESSKIECVESNQKDLDRIIRFVDSASREGLRNIEMENKLQESYKYLVNLDLKFEIVALIKRIHKIRRYHIYKKVITGAKSSIRKIDKIILACDGNANDYQINWENWTIDRVFSNPNEFKYVPIDNPYFYYEHNTGIAVRLKGMNILLSSSQLEELIEKIRAQSKIFLDEGRLNCNLEFINRLSDPAFIKVVTRIDYYRQDYYRSFICESSVILETLKEFINYLKNNEHSGWRVL